MGGLSHANAGQADGSCEYTSLWQAERKMRKTHVLQFAAFLSQESIGRAIQTNTQLQVVLGAVFCMGKEEAGENNSSSCANLKNDHKIMSCLSCSNSGTKNRTMRLFCACLLSHEAETQSESLSP